MNTNWPRIFRALLAQLDTDQPLIIDPPRELLGRLPSAAHRTILDFSIWRQLGERQRDVFFDAPAAHIPPNPPLQAKGGDIILFQPRAKERLSWWLHRLATRFPGRPLWLVGANAEGGRGIGKQVADVFEYEAERVASLGRASLWHCRLPDNPPPAPDPWREWRYEELRIHALPGVFGYRGLDDGTALLLETLPRLDLQGRVLDFGCGTGIVAASAARINPAIRLVLADSDALALISSERTLNANHIEGIILPTDGWHGLTGTFDWIVSNPPFHVGAQADLSIAHQLIEKAPEYLKTGGRLVLVANRHLPLEKPLSDVFATPEKLNENSHFKILSATCIKP